MKIAGNLVPKKRVSRYLNRVPQDGEINVLFLGDPIGGYEWWTSSPEGKRVANRVPLGGEKPDKDAKLVWICPILDLADRTKKSWVIGQKSIQRQISACCEADGLEDGAVEVIVRRLGSGMDSVYSVSTRALDDGENFRAANREEMELGCDPAALFSSGDPFACSY